LADPPTEPGARSLKVTWALSAHARRLITLALAGLLLAVITRRAEFAGLAAPALLVLASWRADHPATVSVLLSHPGRQVVEGEPVAVGVSLGGQGGYSAELAIVPADTITAGRAVTLPGRGDPTTASTATASTTGASTAGAELSADSAELSTARLLFRPERWGYRPTGRLRIVLRDPVRLSEGRAWLELPFIDCKPHPASMQSSIVLSRLPTRLGEHPARATGEGSEFSGVRQFVPGDRQRRINWPATTRRGSIHLSTFAAERTQHTVIIADATADVGEPGASSLDLVLRGAAGAIRRYLYGRDRVGLIIYASRLSWIGPGQGQRHFRRLMDLLTASPAGWERAAGLTRLPRAALPPGALIIVFSPLLDPRLVEAVRDLRERGFSVIIVDVLNAEPRHEGSKLSELTSRIWRLEQEAIRFSLTQIGVPVAHWNGKSSLDEPLAPYTRRVVIVRH
jgi:uncharacterized protein (DUF58 family)